MAAMSLFGLEGSITRSAAPLLSLVNKTRFQVAPPFGHELIVTIASDKPLFGAGLENYGTEREFLTALQTALVRARTAGSPVSAAIRRVNTRG